MYTIKFILKSFSKIKHAIKINDSQPNLLLSVTQFMKELTEINTSIYIVKR